jgi:hypothetical protein
MGWRPWELHGRENRSRNLSIGLIPERQIYVISGTAPPELLCYDVTILNITYSTYINEDRAKPVHGGP